MKNFFGKIFTRDVSMVLFLALFFLGVFKYVEYRVASTLGEINSSYLALLERTEALEIKVSNLEEKLKGAMSYVSLTEERGNYLASQVSAVTSTVGVLSKLSKTDPELLKKYSKIYFLNEHYVPISLSEIGPEYRSVTARSKQIHSNVLPFLVSLINAGNTDKVELLAQSAFRSFTDQTELKSRYKIIYGAGANKFSADQGYSEHQLGTTVDFTTGKTSGVLEGFDKTPEYAWLTENAYKYGFILSYPKGNSYYIYEPWHWRFVGTALSKYLHDNNLNFYDVDQRVIDNYLGNIFD